MCIVRLYLKTFWNHQTVYIFTFVSMKFSDNSIGAFNWTLTCWRIKLEAKDKSASSAPDLHFVIHRNNTTEKAFVCTIFIFLVHDTILCPSRAKDTRFRPYAQKIHVLKISNPTKSFDPLRHLKSLAPGRGHGKEITRFFLFTSTVFNILLLHRTTEYIPYQDSRGPFSKFT